MENNWIKVSDALPKKSTELVLAYSPDVVRVAYLFKDNWYKFENKGELDEIYFSEVTHWQPLPNKPE